jgi:hypothetical protein
MVDGRAGGSTSLAPFSTGTRRTRSSRATGSGGSSTSRYIGLPTPHHTTPHHTTPHRTAPHHTTHRTAPHRTAPPIASTRQRVRPLTPYFTHHPHISAWRGGVAAWWDGWQSLEVSQMTNTLSQQELLGQARIAMVHPSHLHPLSSSSVSHSEHARARGRVCVVCRVAYPLSIPLHIVVIITTMITIHWGEGNSPKWRSGTR